MFRNALGSRAAAGRRKLFGLPLLLVLTGCGAGSETNVRLMEAHNQIRIDPVKSPTHDYVVHVMNVVDLAYDPDDKAQRDLAALTALRAQCPTARIVGESTIERGNYLGLRQLRTYVIQVKCRA